MEYEEFLKHNELNNLYADDILKFNDQEDKFQENTKLVYKFSADYFKDKREKESKNDGVNHPSHYTSGKVEVIDIIEDAVKDAPDTIVSGLQWQVLKYMLRMWLKDNPKKDAQKAQWYLNRLIDKL
jgi:hypothetical protein